MVLRSYFVDIKMKIAGIKKDRNVNITVFEYCGAATTNRTRDLLITSQLLYQLSYCG